MKKYPGLSVVFDRLDAPDDLQQHEIDAQQLLERQRHDKTMRPTMIAITTPISEPEVK